MQRVISYHGLGRAPDRSSCVAFGGHARPGFVGPGFPEDRGEGIGEGRGPAGGQSSSLPFPPRPRVFQVLVTGGRSPSSDVPARLANGHNRLPNEARSE